MVVPVEVIGAGIGAVVGGVIGYLINPKEPLVPVLLGVGLGAGGGYGVGYFAAASGQAQPSKVNRELQEDGTWLDPKLTWFRK